MAIFNSYVKLPEGKTLEKYGEGDDDISKNFILSRLWLYPTRFPLSYYPILIGGLFHIPWMGIIQTRSNQYFIEWQIVTLLSSATIRFGGLRHHSQKLAVSPFPVGSNFAAKHISEVLHFLGMFWHLLLFSELESMRIPGMLRNCVCLTGSFGYFADNAVKWLNILLTICSLNITWNSPLVAPSATWRPLVMATTGHCPALAKFVCAKFVQWRWLSAHAEERARRHHWEQRNIEVLWPCLITIIHSFYMPLQ